MLADKIFTNKNAVVISIIVFLVYFIYRVMLVFFPYPDAGGVENNVIWFIQRLLNGQSLYTDPESSPYSIAQYSPLYYYLNAGIAKLIGIKPDNVFSVFIVSRSISLVLNLLYAYMILKTARKIFESSFYYSIMAGVFAFIFLEITSFSRPDSLSHFFFICCFYYFALWIKKNEIGVKATSYLILSAFFAAAAIFSKQSALVLPVSIFIWFIYKKEIRSAIIFFVTYSLLFALGLLIVHFESGLKEFYQNTILGINNGISFFWFWNNIVKEFYQQFGLLWAPALFIIILISKKQKEYYYHFTAISLLVCFIVNNLFAIKYGSSPGYFTEWCGIVFAGSCIWINKIDKEQTGYKLQLVNMIVIFILATKLMLISYPLLEKSRSENWDNATQFYKNEEKIADRIKQLTNAEGRPIIFNRIYSPDTFLNNFLFRECVLPQYEVVFFGTWHNRVFDYTKFRKGFEDGSIQYIITRANQSNNFMDLKMEHYSIMDTIYTHPVYKYKP